MIQIESINIMSNMDTSSTNMARALASSSGNFSASISSNNFANLNAGQTTAQSVVATIQSIFTSTTCYDLMRISNKVSLLWLILPRLTYFSGCCLRNIDSLSIGFLRNDRKR